MCHDVCSCRTANGYWPRDSNRQEFAASIIERVHKDQAAQGHLPWNARRLINDLEQKAAAKQSAGGSGASGASGVEGPAAKRLRTDGGLAGQGSLQDGPAVDEVIKAFLNGTDALSNTKVRSVVAVECVTAAAAAVLIQLRFWWLLRCWSFPSAAVQGIDRGSNIWSVCTAAVASQHLMMLIAARAAAFVSEQQHRPKQPAQQHQPQQHWQP